MSEVTSIDGLSPGKYCVKITPFNSDGGNCDCTAYFCSEIGSLEAEPITVRARITPIRICYIDGKPSFVLTRGGIRVGASGGWAPNGYSMRWIGNPPPTSIPAPGVSFKQEFRYCVEFTDDCDNKVTKCYTIPQVRVDCGSPEDPEGPTGDDGDDGFTSNDGNSLGNRALGETDIASLDKSQSYVKLFPNPASTELHIEFTALEDTRVEYSIVNIDGSYLLNGNTTTGANGRFIMDVSQFPKGVYYLSSPGFETKRFIIIH